jgi:hypothetical protein
MPGYLQLLEYEKRFHTAWTRSGHSEGVEFNACGPLQLPSRKQRNLKG